MGDPEAGGIVIGAGVTVTGSVSAPADVTVHGTVKGELVAGKVLVGETGIIEGSLKSENADIFGEVGQELEVTDHVTVRTSARIQGILIYRSIEIEAGARLSCELQHTPDAESGSSEEDAAAALVGASQDLTDADEAASEEFEVEDARQTTREASGHRDSGDSDSEDAAQDWNR